MQTHSLREEQCEVYNVIPHVVIHVTAVMIDGFLFFRWSFTFFFYNRKLKRVVSFHFSCLSNLVADGFLVEEGSFSGEDGEIFDDMDI
jgi:hypothetical protein